MSLPNNILSKFAKAAKPVDNTKSESTVYATIVKQGEATYVKIDGSDLLTPVIATADTVDDERVTVMIKDHTAVVTGNLTSPAARVADMHTTSNNVDATSKSLETLTEQVVDLVKQVGECADDIDNLQTADGTINDRLAKHDTDISGMTTNISNNATAIATNTKNISTNTKNISTNTADITSIKNDIVTINGKITNILTEIEAIKKSLT